MASMVSSSPLKSSNKNYTYTHFYNNNPSSNKGSSRISYIIFSNQEINEEPNKQLGRREIILRTSEIAVLGAIFHFGDVTDLTHYAPPWSYNPENGRGRKKPVSREEAMNELILVIKSKKPDNFTPRIVEKKDDYIRVEYESPIMGFVDDVEFWFPPGKNSTVEYRSASRFGNFDFEVNKKRIKALRVELEKKGWASVGTF
ncbi:uncharacterized protein LOC113275129 isoform X2 [Papaver somniferum]|uniref:uncharacterized protein LOC113275129 isoform X2 n=1 Tax=Papaver somniferum TaxID=3469 RepID=UPI000E6F58D4|nr:uncharacterized protein LOC113275129 isoform X2 [Papaver somniferum]